MNYQRIDKPSWGGFFNRISKVLAGQPAALEVAGLDVGDQVEAEWMTVQGLTYDPQDDILYIYAAEPSDLDHAIASPQEVHIAMGVTGVAEVVAIDAEGRRQFVRFVEPVRLPVTTDTPSTYKEAVVNEDDAITLLEAEHQEMRSLLDRLEGAANGNDRELTEKTCDALGKLLDTHTTIEEALFYPAHRDARGDREAEVLFFESIAEHRMVKFLLVELRDTPTGIPRFEAGARLLRVLLERHFEEEEEIVFPSASEHMSEDELMELGRKLNQRRQALADSAQRKSPKSNGRRARSKPRKNARGEARA